MRNNNISIIRVLAMISIIIGHWCNWMHINLYQFGGIGVEIFLFISGYLYSNKKLNKGWLKSRWIKLLPPVWIMAAIVSVFYFFKYPFKDVIIRLFLYLTGFQGIGFIFNSIQLPGFEGLGQTWFITVILFCYVCLSLVKKIEQKYNLDIIISHYHLALIISIIVLTFVNYLGIQLSYLLQFFIGYYAGKIYETKNKAKTWVNITFISLLLGVFRILTHRAIDGTILYDNVIATLSFNVISIWIILSVVILLDRNKVTTKLVANSKIWKHFDNLSYYLYISHYPFIVGPYAVWNFLDSKFLCTLFFILISLIMAELLFGMHILINRELRKFKYYNVLRRKKC